LLRFFNQRTIKSDNKEFQATLADHRLETNLLKQSPAGLKTSISMYEPTADGKRFFVENPIYRYSIGNRTPGLVRNSDGSLDIALQHDAPSEGRLLANWLPAPAGPLQIALRSYLPCPELREGRATMPVIVRTYPKHP
jgi:hypothetical protein